MIDTIWHATCDRCGATADLGADNMDWEGVATDGTMGPGVIGNGAWELAAVLCPGCSAAYRAYQQAIEEAKAAAMGFIGQGAAAQASEDPEDSDTAEA
jgi:hypothetical protein